mmetsp:Transcript_6875/g.17094  ORF Transcript_6875/g.17094 Transcript_6875/m.17094 type:complete len:203 (-) Transcript_6875:16-624(-)
MRLTRWKAPTVMIRTVMPVTMLEMRRKPPVLMLITLCPIMAFPPIPPISPAATLPRPSPNASLLALPCVLVMASTSVSVIICSISATAARVPAVGRILLKVSASTGGRSYPLFHMLVGNSPVILPRSPIVRVDAPALRTIPCSTAVANRMPRIELGIQWTKRSRRDFTNGTKIMVSMHTTTSKSIHPAMSGSTHGLPSTKTS